jgi:hypothetical protein
MSPEPSSRLVESNEYETAECDVYVLQPIGPTTRGWEFTGISAGATAYKTDSGANR